MRIIIFILILFSVPLNSEPSLSRDFYNSYLDSLPDPRVQRKETLEANLLRSLKRILPKEDPFHGKEIANQLKSTDLKYSSVDRSDPFVRGILKEIPNLKEEDFMYIVEFVDRFAFLCYRADPLRYSVDETENYIVILKKNYTNQGPSTNQDSNQNPPSTTNHETTPENQ